jgi:hypothetical protein
MIDKLSMKNDIENDIEILKIYDGFTISSNSMMMDESKY